MNPTDNTYTSLKIAYEFFNKELFAEKLPACLITMQRRGRSYGYFSPSRFENKIDELDITHEIALNPATFKDRSDKEILSTLLHEMVHLWQEENGNPPRKSYHNKEWATKMLDLGLMPSNTGREGGRQTGQSMSHYILEGKKFDVLIGNFIEINKTVIYQDRGVDAKVKAKKNKVKYVCPECHLKAWGKPGISIVCGKDEVGMVTLDNLAL